MAKIMHVYGKCSDLFVCSIDDTETGESIVEDYEGYVPSCSVGGGDDIQFDIDLETGKILNWKNPLLDEGFREAVGIIDEDGEYSWIVTMIDEKSLPSFTRHFGTRAEAERIAKEENPDLEFESIEIDY